MAVEDVDHFQRRELSNFSIDASVEVDGSFDHGRRPRLDTFELPRVSID